MLQAYIKANCSMEMSEEKNYLSDRFGMFLFCFMYSTLNTIAGGNWKKKIVVQPTKFQLN